MLNINFVNDLTLKIISDLLEDSGTNEITFQEELDGSVDINELFRMAHFLMLLRPDITITYCTEREFYPLDELVADLAFREIPFDTIILKNKTLCKHSNYQSQ